MRLFVAVDLPDELQRALDERVAPLRETLPAARWVRPANWHLTLAFLGEVGESRIGELADALAVRLGPESGFAAHFAHLGTFPSSGPVRVLWLGLEPSPRFARLAELTQDAVRTCGLPFDDRPFRSHVTLARCEPAWAAQERAAVATAGQTLAPHLPALQFPCQVVRLLSSVLGRGAPVYRVEAAIPLHAA